MTASALRDLAQGRQVHLVPAHRRRVAEGPFRVRRRVAGRVKAAHGEAVVRPELELELERLRGL